MNTTQRSRRLLAPELVVVDLAHHALRALRRALIAQHPLLDDDDAAPHDPPVQRRARVLLRRADDLRRALHAYRCQVHRVLRTLREDDWPF